MIVLITNKRSGGQGYYVGGPSPLGNPYRMRDEAEREQVIAQYARWLRKRLLKDDQVRSEMSRLYRELRRGGSSLPAGTAPGAVTRRSSQGRWLRRPGRGVTR